MDKITKPLSQSLSETIRSLRKWATDSITYIKRRNHLSSKEKAGAINRLEQYEEYLRTYPLDRVKQESLEQLLEQQFRFNDHARYYEIPIYRLPDNIDPAHNPKRLIYIHVTGDIYISGVSDGDDLLCEPVKFIADLKPKNLLVLFVRLNHSTPRTVHIGLFLRVTGNVIFIGYDKPKPLAGFKQEVHYSLFHVVHLYKVITVSRDAL